MGRLSDAAALTRRIVGQNGVFHLSNRETNGGGVLPDLSVVFGTGGDIPLAGRWYNSTCPSADEIGGGAAPCVQITATPRPTFTPTPVPPLPTNTPRPSRTPTPTITLTPSITPTMIPTARAVMDNGRLTNCDFEPRQVGGLPSRDVNPLGVTTSAPAYAPLSSAEVVIVDTFDDDGTYNAGLGNFVAIRVDSALITTACNRQNGWYYIGYAHLSSVSVPNATRDEPFPLVPSNLQVGMSGSTGTDNIHLDVTVFWLPKQNLARIDPIPSSLGSIDGIPAYEHFNSFIRLATTTVYEAVIIDPVELWAEIVQGTLCQITIVCP